MSTQAFSRKISKLKMALNDAMEECDLVLQEVLNQEVSQKPNGHPFSFLVARQQSSSLIMSVEFMISDFPCSLMNFIHN